MRFIRISAVAFGPIQNRTLTFAPQFNVIFGPNEAGKSTWHAALYAAFCGMKRGQGRSRSDQEFMAQYRPWDFPGRWEVSAVFSLEDGRKIELRQELIDRSSCRATDADLGRDYTNEIINDGSPDGSVWLGLDRRSFLSTACIKQSQLLEVVDNPELLQTHLQRAAATCATNSTAASALQLIENFRAEHVGQDRANSTKPLRRAAKRLEAAMQALSTAKQKHAQYLELMASEGIKKSQFDKLNRQLSLARAIVGEEDATEWEKRIKRVQEILVRHPERPTDDLEELEAKTREVSTALNIWEARPALPDTQGHTSSEIEEELSTLPNWPEGDLKPDPEVLKAEADFKATNSALIHHMETEPSVPTFPETAGFTVEELRQMASVLDEPQPQIDPEVEELCRNVDIDDRLIQQVHTAIQVWRDRPVQEQITSPTADEIRRELEQLPKPTDADLQPTQTILDAETRYFSTKEALRQQMLNRPADVVTPDAGGIAAGELRGLALRLNEPAPEIDAQLQAEHRITQEKAVRLAKARVFWTVTMSTLALLSTVLVVFLGAAPVLIGGAGIGWIAVIAFVVSWTTMPIKANLKELSNLKSKIDTYSIRAAEWTRRQEELCQTLERLNLPANSEALNQLAVQVDAAKDAKRLCDLWQEARDRLEVALENARTELQSLLADKVSEGLESIEDALRTYRKDCEERSRLAALANRRADLELQLKAKLEYEAAIAKANERLNSARAEILQAAALCKVTGDSGDGIEEELQKWLDNAERLRVLRDEHRQQIFARESWNQRQGEVLDRLKGSSLPQDASMLRQLANSIEQTQIAKAEHERWRNVLGTLEKDHQTQAERLRRLVEGKGLAVSDDIEGVLHTYRTECDSREKIASEARRRDDLERQLAARKQTEEAARKIQAQREMALQQLRATAVRCGIVGDDEAVLSQSVAEWLQSASRTIRLKQEALNEWREVDTLLDGKTLEQFVTIVQQSRAKALSLRSDLPDSEFDEAWPNADEYRASIDEVTRKVEVAREELANIQGQIHKYEEGLTSVSDAEEELKAAEEELERIRLLDDTLQTTQRFLTQAQDRIHRDIAPFLAQAIKQWLPTVTLGRYIDARVDPETLRVQVCEASGKWREAALLSHGTAEQVYLLLRLALTEYLTKPPEVCPLILDDVTVQSDGKRKVEILRTLKAISENRQVILFTQEEEVLVWAKSELLEPNNKMIELGP